jgi:hypothetical protein
MYRTGIDPRSMESIYVARGERERRLQRDLLHFKKHGRQRQVIEALGKAGREDLARRLR